MSVQISKKSSEEVRMGSGKQRHMVRAENRNFMKFHEVFVIAWFDGKGWVKYSRRVVVR